MHDPLEVVGGTRALPGPRIGHWAACRTLAQNVSGPLGGLLGQNEIRGFSFGRNRTRGPENAQVPTTTQTNLSQPHKQPQKHRPSRVPCTFSPASCHTTCRVGAAAGPSRSWDPSPPTVRTPINLVRARNRPVIGTHTHPTTHSKEPYQLSKGP